MKCLYRIALGCLCGFACHTAVFAQQPSANSSATLVAVVDIPKVFDAHPPSRLAEKRCRVTWQNSNQNLPRSKSAG